ncbi:fatty acyl-AMP ligase [Streptomyces sp. NPDC058989]|uniref:fatty acyl-AMP ligase n=1 Tax=Streptomyces sp. NPDC058989 TaxID=3346686 RepID=UPI0036C8D9E5
MPIEPLVAPTEERCRLRSSNYMGGVIVFLPDPAPAIPLLTSHLEHWAVQIGGRRAVSMVEFPTYESAGVFRSLTWGGLDARARQVASHLVDRVDPGQRAALLLPQGTDYVSAFLGCLYAGVIAVPLFPPDSPGRVDHLSAVLKDSEPACLITDRTSADAVRDYAHRAGFPASEVLQVDSLAPSQGPASLIELKPDDIAYLQYTSGSTRSPAGVMISHRNAVTNARQAIEAYGLEQSSTNSVGWMPLFHDMGLMLSITAPVVGGFPSVMMDPVAVMQKPVRWLRILSQFPGAVSAAPNFAYDYCVRRIHEQHRRELRLDRVRALVNGSEMVLAGTVRRFNNAFAEAGLKPETHCPSYGLAEATVLASTDSPNHEPCSVSLDPEELSLGKAVVVPTNGHGVRYTVCGNLGGQRVRITDPETGSLLGDGQVGEIRLQGGHVGNGYWNDPEKTRRFFGQGISGEHGEWLRTGDLGLLMDGELIVVGRQKDLIVMDGRNHYPEDLEETVQSVLGFVHRGHVVAFSLPWGDAISGETVIVLAELLAENQESVYSLEAVTRIARSAIYERHGIRLSELHVVAPGSLPRTSSGKISRFKCRDHYIEDQFRLA